MRLCFLSTDDLTDYVVDDDIAIPALRARGHTVETISWHASRAVWKGVDLVIIRSPWDYTQMPEQFIETLGVIDRSTELHNPLQAVIWNADKRYIADLAALGVPTVPTHFFERWSEFDGADPFELVQTPEIILKPTISANARHTYPIKHSAWYEDAALRRALAGVFGERAFMLQPYRPQITAEGEYSVFYFRGVYSHAIRKVPKQGDFRVQEEHGGDIRPYEAPRDMQGAAQRVLDATQQHLELADPLLYARVDFVRQEHVFELMEIEIIEPALYFRTNDRSPEHFANAVDELLGV